MRNWIVQHIETLSRTVVRFVRAPFASCLNAIVIGIAIALPLGLYVVMDNVRALAIRLPAAPELSIYMALNATATDAAQVEALIRKSAQVEELRFIQREHALTSLRRSQDLGDVLEGLPSNPLPDAFVVRLRDASAENLDRLGAAAARWPKVDQVRVDSAWARRLDAALRLGRLAIGLLAGLLAIALLAVTFNTIRLQIMTQRDEIEVSRLIGATNAFIRRPFLYFGLLQGLAGSGAALGIVGGAAALVDPTLADLGRLYGFEFALTLPPLGDALAVTGFAGALGWLGAWAAASRYLWASNGT